MVAGKWWRNWVWWMLCGLLGVSWVGANIAGKLKTALLRHGVIPEIMMGCPKLGIYVAHGKKYAARFGNLVPVEAVGARPTTLKWRTEENAIYTVIALDLDAIPKKHRADETELERLLWLVVNVPAGKNVNATLGDTLAPYIPPTLDVIKGVDHRILYMVFEQPDGKQDFKFEALDDKPDNPRRTQFNVHKFVDEHKLVEPVAVNFYVTREGLLESDGPSTAAAPRRKKKGKGKAPKGKGSKGSKDSKGETTTAVYIDVTAEKLDDEAVEIEYV